MLLARNDGTKTQSLREHSRSAAAIALSRCPVKELETLFYLAGMLHDIGKSFAAWQKYLFGDSDSVVFHSAPGVLLAQRLFGSNKSEYSQTVLQMLSVTIKGHHGGLRDVLAPDGTCNEPIYAEYSEAEIAQAEYSFFTDVCSREELINMFSQSCEGFSRFAKTAIEITGRDTDKFFLLLGFTERALYSAVIDADRTDAAVWQDGEAETVRYTSYEDMLLCLTNRLNGFSKSGIGELRSEVSDECGAFDTGESGIFRLTVPTGGGKTLASIRLCLNMAAKYKKSHIYYFVPYITIIEQNAAEIRKAIGEAPDTADSAVLEHHSNVVFDESENDSETLYLRHCEKWDTPIVMTSVVQFLNALYSDKSSSVRRMNSLANSILVFDEVQSVPTSSTYLFNIGLNCLSKLCGCIIILCTATQPQLQNTHYNLMLGENCEIISNPSCLFGALKRTSVEFKTDETMNAEKLARFALRNAEENGNCLVVVNTKAMALNTFASLAESPDIGDTLIYLLSTSMCPAHRKHTVEDIKAGLKSNKKLICISTQLIEAGVDISFSCAIRSMAGLGSIIQSAGRCNRHAESTIKKVYAVKCDGERLGTLPDITAGQDETMLIYSDFLKNPEAFDFDMTSQKAVQAYYNRFYTSRAKSLNYVVGGKPITELLGYNIGARQEYRSEHTAPFPQYCLAQSFRSAWRGYKPIEDNTTGVVVIYEKSAQLLEELKEADAKSAVRILRSLQSYTVGVFENRLAVMRERGVLTYNEKHGIFILDSSCYNEKLGIDIQSGESIEKYFI